jgi:hypothetical protein
LSSPLLSGVTFPCYSVIRSLKRSEGRFTAETNLQITPGSGVGVSGYTDSAGNFRQTVTLGDTTNNIALLPSGIQLTSEGGANANFAITAGKNTITVVSVQAGRLCKVTVVTLGTAACTFYDSASAASGNVVGVVTASAAVGTIFSFQTVTANGITASASASNPALTVAYI